MKAGDMVVVHVTDSALQSAKVKHIKNDRVTVSIRRGASETEQTFDRMRVTDCGRVFRMSKRRFERIDLDDIPLDGLDCRNVITEFFSVWNTGLGSLEGCPRVINNVLDCRGTRIRSWQGLGVVGSILCDAENIVSWYGFPRVSDMVCVHRAQGSDVTKALAATTRVSVFLKLDETLTELAHTQDTVFRQKLDLVLAGQKHFAQLGEP